MTRILRWSSLAFAGAVAVTACGSGDAGSTASTVVSVADTATATTADTTAGTTADTSAVTTESPTTTAPAATATATASPTTEPPPAADGDCLIGDWVVTQDQMNAFYTGLMSTMDAPIVFEATGSAALSFRADGTYGWAPDFMLSVEVAGQRGEGIAGGTITGDWAAADGVITTASEVNALEVAITVNGVSFSGDDLTNGLLNASPVNGVTYSCDGPSPVLDFKTADAGVTVPITLTPA